MYKWHLDLDSVYELVSQICLGENVKLMSTELVSISILWLLFGCSLTLLDDVLSISWLI